MAFSSNRDSFMRHESLYLEEIRDAADSIARFIAAFPDEAARRESGVVSPPLTWAEIIASRSDTSE